MLALSAAAPGAADRRRPRLLLLVTLAEVGGAQTYVAQLLSAAAGRLDVTVAAWGPGPLQSAAAETGADYVELRHVRRPINPWQDLLGLVELMRLCRRVRPDIVHANSSKAGVLGRLAAFLARVPIRIFTVHGWAFKAYGGWTGRAYLWADRLMRRLTSVTVCVSNSELGLGVASKACDAGRSVVIPNAVELHPLDEKPPNSVPSIVSVGRLKPPKDFRTLVEALAGVQGEFHALIVGDGPDRETLAEAIGALGLEERVELTGTVHDVRSVLAAADVFVLASRSEGMPMSVLEAMAAGLPVVATAVGGIPELVLHEETGLLVPAGDSSALRAAVERLLADGQLRARLGNEARRRIEAEFTVEPWRRAHVALYAEALAQRGLPLPAGETEGRRGGSALHAVDA